MKANLLKLAEKIATNTWDHVDDVFPVVKAALEGRWQWFENPECKYIEVRIDMRDGGCILRNRRGMRIEPAALKAQWSDKPEPSQAASGRQLDASRPDGKTALSPLEAPEQDEQTAVAVSVAVAAQKEAP